MQVVWPKALQGTCGTCPRATRTKPGGQEGREASGVTDGIHVLLRLTRGHQAWQGEGAKGSWVGVVGRACPRPVAHLWVLLPPQLGWALAHSLPAAGTGREHEGGSLALHSAGKGPLHLLGLPERAGGTGGGPGLGGDAGRCVSFPVGWGLTAAATLNPGASAPSLLVLRRQCLTPSRERPGSHGAQAPGHTHACTHTLQRGSSAEHAH